MKFSKFGRVALVSAVSLGLGFGMSACGPSNTIDFIYVTSSKNLIGQINVYKVDSQAGALIPIPDSPYPSGGRNPVADVTSPNGKNLYVINHDDNTVVEFAIGTDGKLYPQQTCNTPGTFPTQLAVNKAGTYLYVVETYQPKFSTSVPGPGALIVFPINAAGGLGATDSLCTPVGGPNAFVPVGNKPAAVNVLASGSNVYVANQTDATLSDFAVDSTGALSLLGTYPVGVAPNALASDPTSKFLYVTDGAANQMIGFLVQLNGSLINMQTPFKTDNLPDAVQVDPRGTYVYVANYNSNDVGAYTIDRATGNATQVSGSTTYAVDAGPLCILIEPAEGRYIYTANFLGNTVSGLVLNPSTGALSAVQNTPFKAASQPTCAAAITHGKPLSGNSAAVRLRKYEKATRSGVAFFICDVPPLGWDDGADTALDSFRSCVGWGGLRRGGKRQSQFIVATDDPFLTVKGMQETASLKDSRPFGTEFLPSTHRRPVCAPSFTMTTFTVKIVFDPTIASDSPEGTG